MTDKFKYMLNYVRAEEIMYFALFSIILLLTIMGALK